MISFSVNPSYFINKSLGGLISSAPTGDIRVTVYPKWFKEVTLEWTIPISWGDASFAIYKSASSETGFEKINFEQIKNNTWLDRETYQDSTHRKDYYIVEATLPTGAILRSQVASLIGERTPFVQIRASEISRRENFMLRKYMGVPSVLFKRKTYGKRCTSCWSTEYKKVTTANCKECAGVGFEGGYFPGTLCHFQYEPSQKNLQFTHFGKLESNQTSCWTTSIPKLEPHDILIRLSDFRVFNMDHVRQTELQGVPLRQIGAISELSHDAPAYELINRYSLMSEALELAEFHVNIDPAIDDGKVIGGSSGLLENL